MLYEDKDELPFEMYDKSHIELQGTVEVGVSIEPDDLLIKLRKYKYMSNFIY